MQFKFLRLLADVSSPGPRYLLRLHLLTHLLNRYVEINTRRVLEIGAGSGDVIAFVGSALSHSDIQILESSPSSLDLLKNRFADRPNISIQNTQLTELQDNSRFELIMAFEVLEHIEDDESLFADISARLAVGGYFMMSVPAYMSKWQTQDVASGHVRRYEEDELRAKLNTVGLEVLELRDYGFPLTSLMRPARELFYSSKAKEGDSLAEKTAASGVDNRLFGRRLTWLVAVCLVPFFFLQRIFSRLRMGDGFVVVAKKVA